MKRIELIMERVAENTITLMAEYDLPFEWLTKRDVYCGNCANWNYNKFPNAKAMGIPCGCTIFRGLGRAPYEYCSRGEEYADNVTG